MNTSSTRIHLAHIYRYKEFYFNVLRLYADHIRRNIENRGFVFLKLLTTSKTH